MLRCSWSHTICNRYNHSIKRLTHIHILFIGLTSQYHCYSGGFVIGITLTNNVMKPDTCYDRCSWRRILCAHHPCEIWLRCPTYGRDVHRSIINKIRTFEFQVVSSLYTRGPVSMGAWMQPSVTNDHHLWSLHKGKLWMSPQHTLQIDLMCSMPGERLVIQVHLPLCHDGWSPRM